MSPPSFTVRVASRSTIFTLPADSDFALVEKEKVKLLTGPGPRNSKRSSSCDEMKESRRKTKSRRSKQAKLRVRRARLSDLDALVHQRRFMWQELGDWNRDAHDRADREYAKWVRTNLRNKTLVGWLVEAGRGRVVGGGTIWLRQVQPRPGSNSLRQPYLLSMYTERDYRGMGVASLVVQEAMAWSRKNGYSSLALHASKMGRGVYGRLGFRRSWEMRIDPTKR